ncbi:hypothetical protein QQ045_032957 [Rhodiola kirilowii]
MLVQGEWCRGLVREATDAEIWNSLSAIGIDKSPGPYGFSSSFFRKNWTLIGPEFCCSIRHCLRYNCLPKGLNSTALALVPNSNSASLPDEYIPISCCNVVYKVISGMLSARLKDIMPKIINQAQGAFVKGRSIVRNVNVAQQLMAGYGRRNISERMAWKIDLRKAYDTISWDFLDSMLHELKFPLKFISWVQMCLKSSSFSVLINGEMVDYFNGKRGIRQGDPLSPFLFLLAMEYLSHLLGKLDKKSGFYYHPKCHRIDLKHILFADDLLLFSSGRISSIITLKKTMDTFLAASGLYINLEKSQVFVAGMPDNKKAWVEQILGTAVAKLPVRYLGIPLNSKAISFQDCSSFIDRITGRIHSWRNRFLSRAGRRLLIQSVLHSILYYWARMCTLPRKVLNTVGSICARFLWKGNALGNGGFLVSWKEVCKAKAEGGLGLKNLSIMKEAMRLNQLWEMRNEADSVWKAWTRAYWTEGRDWWEVENASKTTWIIKGLEEGRTPGGLNP